MSLGVNRILRRFRLELRRTSPQPHSDIVTLTTTGDRRGTALLSYIVEPFKLKNEQQISGAHTNHIESTLLAEVLMDLGYDVDVIDYRNQNFQPSKAYSLFLSARTNFERICSRLDANCVKIAHLDTAHFLYNNAAAFSRLLQIQNQRHVSMSSMKQIEKNWAPEAADALTVLGNDFTLETYQYAGKPMYRLPVPTTYSYASPENKDFDSAKSHFLWLGSSGLAHKGLDLVLEAFSGLPDLKLTVCGPVDQANEKHFKMAFQKELYLTGNIRTVGWVDVGSKQFLDIVNQCAALIYPSCSEGQAGAVVTSMRAGLIPLVSRQSGIDTHEFGTTLDGITVDRIKKAVVQESCRSADDLRARAVGAWQYARAYHSQDNYRREAKKVIGKILDSHATAED